MNYASMEHQKSEMIFGLDTIRALAIFLVLVGHSFQHSSLPLWLKQIGSFGSVGVELFFVLSGFLIGGILLSLIEKNKFKTFSDLLSFWKRRWMRTIPLYVIVLLAFLRFDYHGSHPLTFHPEYWLFLQNFAWPIPDDFFTLSWSLAVEEHFYLWFPTLFLMLFIFVSKKSAFYTTALIFLSTAIIYRMSLPSMDWDAFNFNSRMVVLSRLDAIMFGVLMVYIQRYHKLLWAKLYALFPLWSIFVLALLAWYYNGVPGITSPFIQIFGMTIQALLLSLLLPWFANIKLQPRTIVQKGVVWTSRLSYSLYLGHILVIGFVNTVLNFTGMYDTIYGQAYYLYPLYFIGFYSLAVITYYAIERPFLDLRDGKLSKVNIIRLLPFLVVIFGLVFFA
jgi:peptidoglycan/LPS O-acetylase OafA/YrhL